VAATAYHGYQGRLNWRPLAYVTVCLNRRWLTTLGDDRTAFPQFRPSVSPHTPTWLMSIVVCSNPCVVTRPGWPSRYYQAVNDLSRCWPHAAAAHSHSLPAETWRGRHNFFISSAGLPVFLLRSVSDLASENRYRNWIDVVLNCQKSKKSIVDWKSKIGTALEITLLGLILDVLYGSTFVMVNSGLVCHIHRSHNHTVEGLPDFQWGNAGVFCLSKPLSVQCDLGTHNYQPATNFILVVLCILLKF